jgi:hypothetical protein
MGSVALLALAAIILSVFVAYSLGDSDIHIDGIPDFAIYVIAGLIAICGLLVFIYQIISIFTNKMIFTPEGIEIRKFLKTINIATTDVIRVDGVRERVIGTASQNRSVFKFVTNTKTY